MPKPFAVGKVKRRDLKEAEIVAILPDGRLVVIHPLYSGQGDYAKIHEADGSYGGFSSSGGDLVPEPEIVEIEMQLYQIRHNKVYTIRPSDWWPSSDYADKIGDPFIVRREIP